MWVAIANEGEAYLQTVGNNKKRGVISSCLLSITRYDRKGMDGCVVKDERFLPIGRPLCIRGCGGVLKTRWRERSFLSNGSADNYLRQSPDLPLSTVGYAPLRSLSFHRFISPIYAEIYNSAMPWTLSANTTNSHSQLSSSLSSSSLPRILLFLSLSAFANADVKSPPPETAASVATSSTGAGGGVRPGASPVFLSE